MPRSLLGIPVRVRSSYSTRIIPNWDSSAALRWNRICQLSSSPTALLAAIVIGLIATAGIDRFGRTTASTVPAASVKREQVAQN